MPCHRTVLKPLFVFNFIDVFLDLLSGGGIKEDSKTDHSETAKLEYIILNSQTEDKSNNDLCACWCQGWAEISVKRPTGMDLTTAIQETFL